MTGQQRKAAAKGTPKLATPEQLHAEKILRRLLGDPDVLAALDREEKRLADTEIAKTADGKARLSHAIKAWAGGLTLRWLSGDPECPAILLSTDNTPRRWLGYELPATGAAGDNPDHIYRNCFVDGAGEYEIVGKIDRDRPPAQFGIEVMRGAPGKVVVSAAASATTTRNQIGVITDRELQRDSDGGFRATFGPWDGGPNHVKTSPEPLCFVIRDVLSDWRQVPTELRFRRIDRPSGTAMSYEQVKAQVLADLSEYLDFWTAFPLRWMGGVEANGFKPPVPREGGWGYQAGIRYRLKSDELLVVTMKKGNADYLGIQIADPWFLAPDARHHVTSLNTAQAIANDDGSYTYFVGAEDPGVANWLDTGGIHEGLGVLRWQGVPAGEDVGSYLIEVRKVPVGALQQEYPAFERISVEQRAEQRTRHAIDYARRFEV